MVAKTGRYLIVVRLWWCREKLHATGTQLAHGGEDIVRGHRNVLCSGTLIEIKVFLNLRTLVALRRLVDREFDAAVAIAHHLAHQGRVFGVYLLVIERKEVHKAHHILIPFDPGVHFAPAHVAHHMVDELEAHGLRIVIRLPLLISGQESALVVLAFYEYVHRFAIGVDARTDHLAMLVLLHGGFHEGLRTAFHGLVEGRSSILYPECDHLHTVTMLLHVLSDRRVAVEGRGKHKAYLILLQYIRGAVSHACFQTCVGQRLESKGGLIVVGRLLGIAHIKLHIVCSQKWKEILCAFENLL